MGEKLRMSPQARAWGRQAGEMLRSQDSNTTTVGTLLRRTKKRRGIRDFKVLRIRNGREISNICASNRVSKLGEIDLAQALLEEFVTRNRLGMRSGIGRINAARQRLDHEVGPEMEEEGH